MNGSTSVIRDNTGRTGPLKKLPNLGNEDALSCKIFHGLGKIVQKYKSHLPLGPGMKQVLCLGKISIIFHRDEGRLIPSNYKRDSLARNFTKGMKKRFDRVTAPGAHLNSHNPGDYENLADAGELAVKLYTKKV
eukprot:scaffold36907_cov54-Attheya_sp.AAC.2